MVTFRNNNRRNGFRRNDRNFKNISSEKKLISSFNGKENFVRKNQSRNNHNASKLFEKYNNLAREALSSGDKILSENYFQHADHFKRILNENESFRKTKYENLDHDQQNSMTESTNPMAVQLEEKKDHQKIDTENKN